VTRVGGRQKKLGKKLEGIKGARAHAGAPRGKISNEKKKHQYGNQELKESNLELRRQRARGALSNLRIRTVHFPPLLKKRVTGKNWILEAL